jgi:hypothetical protein
MRIKSAEIIRQSPAAAISSVSQSALVSRWDGNSASIRLPGMPKVRGGPRKERSNLASYRTARSSKRRLMNGSAFSARKRQCAACCFKNSLSITTHPWTQQTLINNRVIQSEPRVGGNTKPLLQSNNPQPAVPWMIERLSNNHANRSAPAGVNFT